MATAIAPHYGVTAAGPLDGAEPQALALVPAGYCQQNTLLPLRIDAGHLVVATANPLDQNLTERTRFLARRSIEWVLAAPQDIEDAVFFAYAQEASRLAKAEEAALQATDVQGEDNSVVKLGRALLSRAIDMRASDLHLQPFLGAFAARIRVDGVLRRLHMLPDAVALSLIRHFKVRGGMDSTNFLIPQDGRMSVVHGGRDFDLRISTLPASRGERLVIRFLDQSRVHRLGQANFSHAALQTLRRAVARPSGMVVMTGPTGSGKTSTLYGILAELNRSTVNIITLENPIEYRMAGISQVEVNDKAGRTFHAALRSILRQDPDIVLIGEIRDAETAEIACQAALTGHLVLSTMHTNDALTAIPRLLNLGVQPSILADSLALVIAQRLCRMLCVHCKVPVTDPLTPMESVFEQATRNRPGYRATGCKACDFTGYRGRLPIVDAIEMRKALRDAVSLGESRLSALEKLREGGLKSLAASGSLRIISGETTVSEVMESVGPTFWSELSEHYGTTFDPEAAGAHMGQGAAGQPVLVIGQDAALVEQLRPALEHSGQSLTWVSTAEEAHAHLQEDEDITFIIGDLADGVNLTDAAEQLRLNRLHTSWSRLPALVLVPTSLAGQEERLRATGVMASFMAKPVDAQAVVDHIRQAHAR